MSDPIPNTTILLTSTNMDEREKHIRALVFLMTSSGTPSLHVGRFLEAGEYGLALSELAGEISDAAI